MSDSVAAMLYGEPRVTHDVDLLMFLPADRLTEFAGMFPDSDFYGPPNEVLLTESSRERGHFNVIHSAWFESRRIPDPC